jgi:hypothetical protein
MILCIALFCCGLSLGYAIGVSENNNKAQEGTANE